MTLQRIGWWMACTLLAGALLFDLLRWVRLYCALFSPPLSDAVH